MDGIRKRQITYITCVQHTRMQFGLYVSSNCGSVITETAFVTVVSGLFSYIQRRHLLMKK